MSASPWRQPFPAPVTDRSVLYNALYFGGFVAAFLLLFKPFGIGQAAYAGNWMNIAGFGAITAGGYLLLFGAAPRLLPRLFSDDQWRVGHQFLYYLLLLLLIALVNGTYINWLLDLPLRWPNVVRIVTETLLLGSLPISLLLLFQYNRRLRRAVATASSLSSDLPTVSEEEGDEVLLAARAQGNYVACYFAGRKRELRRTTLARLHVAVDHPDVVRCHRSWLVHLGRVDGVTGNAQGLQLRVAGLPTTVPVSRSHLTEVRRRLRALACRSSQ